MGAKTCSGGLGHYVALKAYVFDAFYLRNPEITSLQHLNHESEIFI